MRKATFAPVAASIAWLVACAAPEPASAPPGGAEMRVLVKLVKASTNPDAVAAQVTVASGTQARYLAATSPQWHALALVCASAQACEAAFQRLGTNNAVFEVVQRDERKRIAAP